jgi:hypothetical protein
MARLSSENYNNPTPTATPDSSGKRRALLNLFRGGNSRPSLETDSEPSSAMETSPTSPDVTKPGLEKVGLSPSDRKPSYKKNKKKNRKNKKSMSPRDSLEKPQESLADIFRNTQPLNASRPLSAQQVNTQGLVMQPLDAHPPNMHPVDTPKVDAPKLDTPGVIYGVNRPDEVTESDIAKSDMATQQIHEFPPPPMTREELWAWKQERAMGKAGDKATGDKTKRDVETHAIEKSGKEELASPPAIIQSTAVDTKTKTKAVANPAAPCFVPKTQPAPAAAKTRLAPPAAWGSNFQDLIRNNDRENYEKAQEDYKRKGGATFQPELQETYIDPRGKRQTTVHNKVSFVETGKTDKGFEGTSGCPSDLTNAGATQVKDFALGESNGMQLPLHDSKEYPPIASSAPASPTSLPKYEAKPRPSELSGPADDDAIKPFVFGEPSSRNAISVGQLSDGIRVASSKMEDAIPEHIYSTSIEDVIAEQDKELAIDSAATKNTAADHESDAAAEHADEEALRRENLCVESTGVVPKNAPEPEKPRLAGVEVPEQLANVVNNVSQNIDNVVPKQVGDLVKNVPKKVSNLVNTASQYIDEEEQWLDTAIKNAHRAVKNMQTTPSATIINIKPTSPDTIGGAWAALTVLVLFPFAFFYPLTFFIVVWRIMVVLCTYVPLGKALGWNEQDYFLDVPQFFVERLWDIACETIAEKVVRKFHEEDEIDEEAEN